MKIAYFDCPAGASGDMLLGALVDAGAPLEKLQAGLGALHLPGFRLESRTVAKGGLRATQVEVVVEDHATARDLAEIEAVLRASDLAPEIARRASQILRRIGTVEAGIHGAQPDQVHLHELGGLDTIVDVVGTLLGLAALEIERVVVSPLPLGRGFIHIQHGAIPLPAPATLALLEGAPVTGSEIEAELVTPTGAALLTSLADSYGPIPSMRLLRSAYGAGRRDLPIPNVLRLLIGESATIQNGQVETLTCLETNLDDLNPEIYGYLVERLLEAGALDVTLSPIQMKKNRPGTLVSVLARPPQAAGLREILYAETTTLGLRQYQVERHALPRRSLTVKTPYGLVKVKVAEWAPGREKCAPEYEDCRRLAAAQGVPLREVYAAAQRAAEDELA